MSQDATLTYQSATLPIDDEVEPVYYGLTLTAWVKIIVVAVLMAATFRFNLVRLWLKTNPFSGEPNWRHAVCVPLIGIYFLVVHRDELLATRTYTAWSGLGILLFGILTFTYGIYPGQNDFVKDIGMVVTLFGVVALLCGWQVMKLAWFPIVFLVCAIPWPELVYSYVASPLQHLAASVAVGVLRICNVEALNSGTKIIIHAKGATWRTLNVAEACAGLRSLMTFISVAAAVAFLSARPLWQKLIVTLSAIPIAIFCNVMRVSGQGLLDHYWSQELSEGFAHQFVGIVMLVPGFFLIMLVGWLLDVVFIEVADDREEKRRKSALLRPSQPAEWTLPRASLAGAAGMLEGAGGGGDVHVPVPQASTVAVRKPTPLAAAPSVAPVVKSPAVKPAAQVAKPPVAKAVAASPVTSAPVMSAPVAGASVAKPAVVQAPAGNPVRRPAAIAPPQTGGLKRAPVATGGAKPQAASVRAAVPTPSASKAAAPRPAAQPAAPKSPQSPEGK